MQIGLEGVCGHCEADQPLDGSRLGGTDCDDGGDNGIRSKETTNCVGDMDMDIIHVAVHERGPSGSPAGNVQLIGKAYHGGLKPNCWRHSSTGRSRRLGRRRRRRARRQQRWWRRCVRSAACGSEDERGTKEHAVARPGRTARDVLVGAHRQVDGLHVEAYSATGFNDTNRLLLGHQQALKDTNPGCRHRKSTLIDDAGARSSAAGEHLQLSCLTSVASRRRRCSAKLGHAQLAMLGVLFALAATAEMPHCNIDDHHPAASIGAGGGVGGAGNDGFYIEGIAGIINDERDLETGKMADNGTWAPGYYKHGEGKLCTGVYCSASDRVTPKPQYVPVHTCARLRFEYAAGSGSTVYELPDQAALDACDFANAVLLCDETAGSPCDILFDYDHEHTVHLGLVATQTSHAHTALSCTQRTAQAVRCGCTAQH